MSAKQRVKCPHCGEVSNVQKGVNTCVKCQKNLNLSNEGRIYLHRQGTPFAAASSFGIYLNNEPFGHIGTGETLCFPLPYGTYNIHCTSGMNRKCRDMAVTLSPQNPQVGANVYIKMGLWTNPLVVVPLDLARLEL